MKYHDISLPYLLVGLNISFSAVMVGDLQIVAGYNCHMGYVDKGGRMANKYSINHCTWKWTKKLFFNLFDLIILNTHILFYSF
jgi:hypothetical protein